MVRGQAESQMTQVRIGVDFDNTIAGYDRVFAALAAEHGLNSSELGGKQQIRDGLRRREGGELIWRQLQSQAYGPRMSEAELMPGVETFFTTCREHGAALCIVSHKTRYANFGDSPVDLRRAALSWMTEHGFFEDAIGLAPDDVHFGDTRQQKIAAIAELQCDVFIDDLIEVFSEISFPEDVRAILYDPKADTENAEVRTGRGRPVDCCPTWDVITERVFGPN